MDLIFFAFTFNSNLLASQFNLILTWYWVTLDICRYLPRTLRPRPFFLFSAIHRSLWTSGLTWEHQLSPLKPLIVTRHASFFSHIGRIDLASSYLRRPRWFKHHPAAASAAFPPHSFQPTPMVSTPRLGNWLDMGCWSQSLLFKTFTTVKYSWSLWQWCRPPLSFAPARRGRSIGFRLAGTVFGHLGHNLEVRRY